MRIDIERAYKSKLMSAEDAISLIGNDDRIFTSCEPMALFEALYHQRDRFKKLGISTMMGFNGMKLKDSILDPEAQEHFDISTSYVSKAQSIAIRNSLKINQLATHFSRMEAMIENSVRPTVLLSHVAPMDAEGFFGMGYCAGCGRIAVDNGARVILQVNKNLPTVMSDYYKIHISEVTAICEQDDPVIMFEDVPPSVEDEEIAKHLVQMIPDGATIQLGIGGVPNAVGYHLKNHRHLGVHTEVFTNTITYLMKQGIVDNSRKTLYPGVSVCGFAQGNQETNDFINHNPNVMFRKLAWVNDPEVVAQNNDMISINSCMGVDLRGQVCSESMGNNIYAAIGGQLDFVRGAQKAVNGKSFIAMKSAIFRPGCDPISKITLNLPEGSVVSTPRSDVQYIVTEYGIAQMKDRSARERTLSLISIAHPMFREKLRFEAKKTGLI